MFGPGDAKDPVQPEADVIQLPEKTCEERFCVD